MKERIVLAHSGGSETSAAIARLAAGAGADVITVTLDLGQRQGLDALRERALALGALRAHVLDVRDELARDFALPALQAGAIGAGRTPLFRALAQAIVAKHLLAIARIEDASAVAHAGPRRLTRLLRAIDPSMKILPLAASREEAAPRAHTTLLGREIGESASAGSSSHASDDAWLLTKSPAEAPDSAAMVELHFESGAPTGINGVEMPLVELMQSLETIAGAHGVGRMDACGEIDEPEARIAFEAPAMVVLDLAHRSLQSRVVPETLERLASDLGRTYADAILDGSWFSTTREAIDAFAGYVQQRVNGVVRLQLLKGAVRIAGVTPAALSTGQVVSGDSEVAAGAPRS